MAASETHMCERESGYQCQFISEVSDDLLCGICRLVAREPHSTSCCGELFCKNCITQVLDASKLCPCCNEADFAIFPDKRDQKKILALQVCCTMKGRGCEWVGKLEDLQAHLSKVCLLQEVSCELSHAGCKETFLREDEDRHMEENTQRHLLQMSAMSQRMCQEFEQKLQEQREEKERERKHMQQALEECEGRIAQTREELKGQITLAKGEFEQKLQEQREEKEREIAEVKQELREKDDHIRALEEKREQEIKALRENSDRAMKALKEEKDKQMKEMEVIESVTYQLQVQGIVQGVVQLQHVPYRCTPPVCFTVYNFNKLKTTNSEWTSPDLYTHEGGYKICFKINPNGIYVHSFAKPGEFDDQLKWPVEATFTLQLLNQHRDRDHLGRTWECHWSKPTQLTCTATWYIPHTQLGWNGRKQTEYLKSDRLVFRLSNVEKRISEL